MKFDIYGRFEMDVIWEGDQWIAYRTGNGLRRKEGSVPIPGGIKADEIAIYLDDLFHELARPGDSIHRLD